MTTALPFHITTTHNAADFSERIQLLSHGIRTLGYDVTCADAQLNPNAINIVLGSHAPLGELNNWARLSQQASHIIIYNLEHVTPDAPCFTQRYLRQMTHTHVWDDHLDNIHALKLAGVRDIHHVPLSQHNAAQVLQPAIERYLAQSKRTPPEIGNLIDHHVALPTTLQIGAGEAWHYSHFNIDANIDFAPDLSIDISAPLPFGESLSSWRFGQTTLEPAYFDKIMAKNVFQRVKDFKQSLRNCLDLLKDGGTLHISVPLDLSYEAWSHIDDRRAFNDRTWEHIVNDFWRYEFNTHRFEVIETGYGVNNAYGVAVLTENGGDWVAGRKAPRVVDHQNLVLRKRPLNEDEHSFLLQARFMD